MDFCPFDHLCGDAAANRKKRVVVWFWDGGIVRKVRKLRMTLERRRAGGVFFLFHGELDFVVGCV